MKLKYIPFYLLIILLISFTSCKKTIGLDPLPQNLITEYKITSIEGDIYGAVNESNKTITVYLPVYYKLGVIDPIIKVSAGAKLDKEVLPVKLDDTTVSYTVVAADHSSSTYKLSIVMQQQTPLFISNVNSSYFAPNTDLSLGGNFFVSNPTDVHVTLVGADGKETKELLPHWSGYAISQNGALSGLNSVTIPADIEDGTYKVKVKIFSLSALSENIEIKHRLPGFAIFGITTKIGNTFKIIAAANTVFQNFTAFTGTINGVTYKFPIVSYTPTDAVIQLPAELKPGVYDVTFTGTFTGWPNVSIRSALTITE